jgi:hypothetical protein
MTKLEYQLLRDNRSELNLPTWDHLVPEAQVVVAGLTEEDLITRRCARLLARAPGVVDTVRNSYEDLQQRQLQRMQDNLQKRGKQPTTKGQW